MCRRMTFMLAIVLLASLVASTVFASDPSEPFARKRVIIKFTDDATPAEQAAIRNDLGGLTLKTLPLIDAEVWQTTNYMVPDAVAKYTMHEKIEYIEPDYEVHVIEIPNDPRFDELYGLHNTGQTGGTAGADISAVSAWDVFTGSDDVIVVVIDTGFDYNHNDLAGNAWTNPGEIAGNGLDDDGNGFIDDIHGWDFYNGDNDPMDDHGHGTHCSGTIGAVGNNAIGVVGVCWDVTIMGVKFLGSGGTGYTSDAILSIDYALTIPGVKVMSNSWGGGGYSEALEDAIERANAAGVLFVCAAGNYVGNTDISPNYPSCYDVPNVMSIAATDHNDELASFSGYGLVTVDLGAPGDDILSTLPGNSYGLLGGTSMATPHVSGVAALIWGRFPAMTVPQVKSLIMNSVDPIPALDGLCVTGGRLNAFTCIAEPDSIPPAAVDDIVASNAGSNSMDLSWTATGDDGLTGTASYYDVRYSTSPINEANFFDATAATGVPDPGPAGTLESMTVTGLDFSTYYYFAIKVLDEYANYSDISTLAEGMTLGAPDIDVDPSSMAEELLAGASSSQTLTVSNIAEGTLDFEIPEPTLILGSSVMGEYVPIGKDEEDTRTGDPVIQGKGGPDAYGYRWIDSDELGGPVFDWVDITTVGTLVPGLDSDDENVGPIPIGFDFEFYGNTFSEFYVCTNGWISFTSTATSYSNQPLPNTGAPENLVAPFWDDLNFSSAERCYYYNDGSRLIVEWYDVPHFSAGGPYTFELILYPNGEIVYQYLSMADPTNSTTVGTQNFTQDDGLEIAFNTDYIHDDLAIKISKLPQWVTVSPTSGRVWGGSFTDLSVNFNSEGLLGGYFDANILISSNDPDEPTVIIPVELHVLGAPDIAVTPVSLDFGSIFIGATKDMTVMVSNPGTDQLDVSAIASDNTDFTVAPVSFSIPPRSGQMVTVTYAASAAGPSSGTLTVYSNDPDEPEVYIAVQGTGLIPPEFTVTPSSLYSDLMTGETETQTLTISNEGGSDLEFAASVELYTGTVPQYHESVELAKGEEDTQPGILGTGGPDAFGYSWTDSDEPDGPSFDWVDISGVGTDIFGAGTNQDDVNAGPFPIGFDFSFYGNTFSEFYVCTNGWVSFTSNGTSRTNQVLPNDGYGIPENLLAIFWDDLYHRDGIGTDPLPSAVYYYDDGSRLIIQFEHMYRYGYYTDDINFEIILYPNGKIVYQYDTVVVSYITSHTIGIQNEARDDGLTVVYNDYYVHEDLAIVFSAMPEWLTVSPASGTIPPGESMVLSAVFNATDLYGGDYLGDVHLDTNDPNVPRYDVPAHMHVTGAPDIAADPDNLDFGTVFIGVTKPMQFYVVNSGTDLLTVTDIVPGSGEYIVDETAFTLLPMESRLVTVSFSPTAVGDRSSVLTIHSDDPDEPELDVTLVGFGLIAPDIAVTPESVSDSLFTGQTSTHTVRVENFGGSDLYFDTAIDLSGEVVMDVFEDVPKGEEGTQKGGPQTESTGGPDMFGYTWVDSDEPGGPIFDWIDITTVGTLIPLDGDDESYGPVPIGFEFPFYGNNFGDFYICTNGFISFTCDDDYFSNRLLPSDYYRVCENMIAGWWDDMKIQTDDYRVYVYNDGTKCIIEFYELARLSTYDPGVFTFEIILYPTGKIVCQYLTMVGQIESATLGIQNATKDDGLTVVYNDAYMHDNLAVEFAYIADWLSVNPTSGTVPPGGYLDLDVRFNAAELFGGDYEGGVNLVNNDPDEGLVTVPAYLHVTGAPDIDVDPMALDFGWVYISLDRTLELSVYNAGTDLLEVTSLSIDNSEFTTDLTPFSLNPRETRTLEVVYTPVTPGVVTGTLTILSNDEDELEVYVALTGEGVIPPEIEIDPDSVTEVAMQGMVVTETVRIDNTGGSDLIYDVGAMQAERVPVYEYLEVPKGEEDPRPGILGAGGPDAFGYTWVDSDEPGGPVYDWVEISEVGTPVFEGYVLDGNEGPFDIGFTFSFYGNDFTQLYICSNGWVSFTSTSTQWTNQPLPNSGAPENQLAIFWDDLVHRSGTGSEPYPSTIYYYNDGTRFIIQYQHMYGLVNYTDDINFEIILYPNGDIIYQYGTPLIKDDFDSHTIGIQNATKDDGLTVVFNDYYAHEELAIRFSTGPKWLSVSPISGIIPAGEYEDLTVTCDARELEDGIYEGLISILSNDLTDPVVDCPVTFIVDWEPAAWLNVDPNTLNLGSNGRFIEVNMGIPIGFDAQTIVCETAFFVAGDDTVGPPHACEILGPDEYGIYWMHAKFDRAAVEEALPDGDSVEVVVAAELEDVTYIKGTDVIKVIRPTVNHPNGGETFVYGPDQKIIVSWETPETWTVDTYAVYFSADGGESWVEVASGITTQSVIADVPTVETEAALYRVYAFQGDEVVGYDTSDDVFTIYSPTGAGIVDDVVPTVFALRQNAPNPFTGITMLRFDLPKDSQVRLDVFDVRGRLVKTLVNQSLPAGRYNMGWNGRDSSGDRVASGVYYYRIQAGQWTETKTMVHIR